MRSRIVPAPRLLIFDAYGEGMRELNIGGGTRLNGSEGLEQREMSPLGLSLADQPLGSHQTAEPRSAKSFCRVEIWLIARSNKRSCQSPALPIRSD